MTVMRPICARQGRLEHDLAAALLQIGTRLHQPARYASTLIAASYRNVTSAASDCREALGRLLKEDFAVLHLGACRLRAVLEHPSEVIVVLRAERDADGEITDWIYREANANALELLGTTRDALVGRRLSEVLPADRSGSVSDRCTRVLLTRTPEHYQSRFGVRDFLATIYSIGDDCIVSTGVDVTERTQAEATLRESETRFRELANNIDQFLAMLAYELRNPVAPIGNVAEVLSRMLAEIKGARPVRAERAFARPLAGRPWHRPGRVPEARRNAWRHNHRQQSRPGSRRDVDDSNAARRGAA